MADDRRERSPHQEFGPKAAEETATAPARPVRWRSVTTAKRRQTTAAAGATATIANPFVQATDAGRASSSASVAC